MKENVALAPFTTLKIGGVARYFIEVGNLDELKEALKFAKSHNLPYFILGGGSNVLICDSGFRGLVIKTGLLGIKYHEEKNDFLIEVEAGENWDNLVKETVKKNISGFENLSGIPGSVGATPVQNIGAYGKEISNLIDLVEVYDVESEKIKKINNAECEFNYRESIFKKAIGKKFIIVKVHFRLPKNELVDISYQDLQTFFKGKGQPNAKEVRKAVIEIRKSKFPSLTTVGTAGSFFKNPVIKNELVNELRRQYREMPVFRLNNDLSKVSGAYLIDKVANLKGLRVGQAEVWQEQALVLVNLGKAKANDVLKLAEKIKKEVLEKTGVALEEEVQYIK